MAGKAVAEMAKSLNTVVNFHGALARIRVSVLRGEIVRF